MVISGAVLSAIPDCTISLSIPPPTKKEPPAIRMSVMIAHKNTCVSPTKPIPIIFPIIKSKGLTDEIMISMIRFVFSSITPCMTIAP